jgi:NIPSNAP
MIYELRIYRAVPGRLSALMARFQDHTLRIWERLGIRQTGFWTTIVGDSNQELTYMLAWSSMAEREKRWGMFLADAEWLAISAESEKNGQLVADIRNALLAPTAFSAAK